MRAYLLPAAILLLSAQTLAFADASEEIVKIAKSNGAVQCQAGHVGLLEMQADLSAHQVRVLSRACGVDGLMHIASCGAEAGELNIFTIAKSDFAKSQALGFQALSDWPDAAETPCKDSTEAARDTIPNALNISIGGIGPGVDASSYRKVRRLIGVGVTRGILDRFVIQGYGREGGISACVEQGRFASQARYDLLLKALRAIKPNPKTTAYSLEPTSGCSVI